MKLINRAVIIVIPKKPYIDWANSLDDVGPKLNIDDPHNEFTAYLIDDVGRDSDLARALKRYYRTIFEHELVAWHTDPKAWPRKRDFRTFKDWFEVQLSSMALDLCAYRIEVEEFEE